MAEQQPRDTGQQQQQPEYMTTEQVAAMINLAPFTLYQWRRLGRGPAFVRLGRAIRYKRRDVERYLEAQRVGCGE